MCEREAEVLKGKAERIRLLMLAAELAGRAQVRAARRATQPPTAGSARRPTRATSAAGAEPPAPARPIDPLRLTEPLRRILAIEPGHIGAFEQLREILVGAGDHAALAEVLAARIAVATNPFEVAALRLARADLLAGPLGNAEAAKEELRAILHKEPQHGKALARLADLQYEAGAFAEAAELYLKRALAERSPERLREIFLRIGRIYTRHHHDAKRAADAYKRVLQLEAENREALVALSDLLIEAGDSKNAIAVTDRLVDLTPEVDKRVPYLIRPGAALGAGGRSAPGGRALSARGRRRASKSGGGGRDGSPLRAHARSAGPARPARPRAALAARRSARRQARSRGAARDRARHALARARGGGRGGRAACWRRCRPTPPIAPLRRAAAPPRGRRLVALARSRTSTSGCFPPASRRACGTSFASSASRWPRR